MVLCVCVVHVVMCAPVWLHAVQLSALHSVGVYVDVLMQKVVKSSFDYLLPYLEVSTLPCCKDSAKPCTCIREA